LHSQLPEAEFGDITDVELKQRSSELRVLNVRLYINEMLLGLHILCAVIPVLGFLFLSLKRYQKRLSRTEQRPVDGVRSKCGARVCGANIELLIESALPVFGLPGQTSTQLPQPRQSITPTWIRKCIPFIAAGAFISIVAAFKPLTSFSSSTNGRIQA